MDIRIDTWANFKTTVIAQGLTLNYYTNYDPDTHAFAAYEIFAIDRTITWMVTISASASSEVTDFETYYKPYANKTQAAQDNYGFGLVYEVSVSQTEIPIVLLRNPAGSGKIIRLDEVMIACQSNTSGAITCRIYYSPTITTNGTVYTPVWGKVMASPPASSINAYLSPTISANGTKKKVIHSMTGESLEYDFNDDPLLVDPNMNLLFTLTCFGNSRPAGINLTWREV
jgi:hypothetical protein